jgi:hypothetical protein
MVPGGVKFVPGVPKLQLGKFVALGGVPLRPQLRVTVPLNPFAPVTVIKQVPDCPADAMVIVEELQPGDTLIPALPTVTVTEDDTGLAK